tara:strand:+ start:119 stop:1048 length:930 start_codon:yes stop_codon:yes gene_type:complete
MNHLTPQDRITLDNYNDMTVGQIFRRAREDNGYNLNDIATHLNIASTHLEAIEADDIGSLPPKVYAVGFVRAYADVLALDSEKMAYLFKVQFYGKNQTDQQKFITRVEGKTVSLHDTLSQKGNVLPAIISAAFVAILVLCAFAFFIVWLITPSDKTGEITVPDVPVELKEEIADTPPAEDKIVVEAIDEDDTENADVVEPIQITVRPDEGGTVYGVDPLQSALALKAVDKSWMEIRDLLSGSIIMTRTLNKGDVFYASEDQDIIATTGNAGGIEIYLDGKSLGLMGKPAEVIRARPFSVQSLRLQNKGE